MFTVKFNGTPVFRGTEQECKHYIETNYSDRAQRFCRIVSPEELKEQAEYKLISNAKVAPKRRSFSSDGDFEYYT